MSEQSFELICYNFIIYEITEDLINKFYGFKDEQFWLNAFS